jgi:hypothetical protein
MEINVELVTKRNAEYMWKILFAVVWPWQETIASGNFGIRRRDAIGYQIPCLEWTVREGGM